MSEQVIRHRGPGRNENSEWIPGSDAPLTAIGVAPSMSPGLISRPRTSDGRDGKDIGAVVYFALGTDLVDSDELTVRGQRFGIIVNEWRMGNRGGLEVLCTRGQG